MWQLLILLALWLGTVGLGRAELTAAQHQGLQVALEEFHKHPRVQWAFQKTSVDSAMDKVSSMTPGREGVRASPQEAQEAGAKVLGFCEHPAPWRKATTPAINWVVLFHCGVKGQVTFQELLCLLHWLLAFLCLSAALPGRDLCEAGIYAPADRLWEEGLEENRVQGQAQWGEWRCAHVCDGALVRVHVIGFS